MQGRGLEFLTREDVPKWQEKQRGVRSAKVRHTIKPQISSHSDKLIHSRFEADFEAACHDLNVITSGSEADGYRPDVQISCASMSQLLLRLGFVSRSLSQEEQLDLAEIWRRIGGDGEGQGTVALSNLKNMLRAIQNFHHQDIMDTEREENPQTFNMSRKVLGRGTPDGLLFTSDEIEHISRQYRELFKNRQDRIAEDKTQIKAMKSGLDRQETYSPQFSKKSRIIAERKNS